jgi:long-chain acyl-CoA synthetase
LPGVEIKIIDQNGNPLPPGKSGEVVLRGPNVMKGYFGELELTAATLVDGWLKTGDLGYLDEDGFLYLVGREKEIIKCAGERISPAEIEEVLMCHPKVAEAAVTGRPDPTLGEIVHAFIVPKGNSLEEGELKTYCAKMLSHHKLPRRYTFVEELPKTPTGKVKKHLLKSP